MQISRDIKIFIFCLLFFVVVAVKVYPEGKKAKIDFKISGGLSYLQLGDWNAHLTGWNDSRRKDVEAEGGKVISENQPLHWSLEMEGEFIYSLSSRFAVGLGTGYIHGKVDDSAETLTDSITVLNFNNFKVSAIPLKTKAYYVLNVSPKARISLGGGVGYYFARLNQHYRREPGTGYWIETDMTGKCSGFGAEGSISFEYAVKSSLSVFIEGLGRYARISGVTGTRERHDSNNWSDSIEGSYYALDRERSGEWYPVVNIATEAPSEEGTRNVRDAILDFSGFTIRAGLKIRLF